MRSAAIYSLVLILAFVVVGCSKQEESAQAPQAAATAVTAQQTKDEPAKHATATKTSKVSTSGPADTVAIKGKIYTVNPKQPWAEAIAIKGEDNVYTSDSEGAKAYMGKNTA